MARQDRGAAEPVRFALLGLLMSGPSHGYDLARQFASGTALGDVVRLSPSHLYALLARLERGGMIVGEQQDVGMRPQRRVFRPTDPGREALLAWVAEPVGHPRDMRIEFPLKLYIARSMGDEHVATLVNRQRDVFHAYVQRLEEQSKGAGVEGDAAFIDLMRAGRIGRARDALAWLDRCEETVLSRR